MIFVDLEKIFREQGIPNKYILTQVVTARARQMSEQKGRSLADDSNEKFITLAIDELKAGKLQFRFAEAQSLVPAMKRTHVVVDD